MSKTIKFGPPVPAGAVLTTGSGGPVWLDPRDEPPARPKPPPSETRLSELLGKAANRPSLGVKMIRRISVTRIEHALRCHRFGCDAQASVAIKTLGNEPRNLCQQHVVLWVNDLAGAAEGADTNVDGLTELMASVLEACG